jgi:dUTP pyrophosphatase
MGQIIPVPVQIRRVRAVELPAYQTPGSSGLDLHAIIGGKYLDIPPNTPIVLGTGIAIALPDGYEAQVRPRSGLASRQGLVAVLGTIDADYRGEIMVTLINHGRESATIHHLDRVAQLVIAPVTRISWDEVETLPETTRGERGHGSTGVK